MRRYVQKFDREEARELRAQGLTYAEIGQQLGVHKNSVKDAISDGERIFAANRQERRSARFWSKVEKTDGCWFWQAFIRPDGYGFFGLSRRRGVYAHRFAYEDVVGPIPEGLTLDHLCLVKHCVNPAHLEPVTLAENISRRWRRLKARAVA